MTSNTDVRDLEGQEWVPPTWAEIVEEHSARVYRLAYRLTGDVHDAEDLTHDVFVRVFRSLDGYTPGTFEGWLHRITTNLFLDRARRKQRIRFDALTDEFAALLHSGSPSPEQVVLDHHLDADIQRALDALPPQFRAAVVLCDIEGLTYEEVAEALVEVLAGLRHHAAHRVLAEDRLEQLLPDDGGAACTPGSDVLVRPSGSVTY